MDVRTYFCISFAYLHPEGRAKALSCIEIMGIIYGLIPYTMQKSVVGAIHCTMICEDIKSDLWFLIGFVCDYEIMSNYTLSRVHKGAGVVADRVSPERGASPEF
jgi:hypothetical protein